VQHEPNKPKTLNRPQMPMSSLWRVLFQHKRV